MMTREAARARFRGLGPAGEFLAETLSRWLDRSPALARRITGSAESWPVWDCGAAAVPLGLARVQYRPRPALRDDRTFDHDHPRGTIGWVTSIDSERLWSDLAARVKGEPSRRSP